MDYLNCCFDEGVFIFIMVVVATVIMAIGLVCMVLFSSKPDAIQRFHAAREVLIIFIVFSAMILGFYFGRYP